MSASQEYADPAAPLASRDPVIDAGATKLTAAQMATSVEQDRLKGIERIIELSRWVVLVFAAVSVNFPGTGIQNPTPINLVLGGWALLNLATTLMLLEDHLPNRQIQSGMLLVDLMVGGALVYLDGGIASNLAITFYVVVIAGSLRLGLGGSLSCAVAVSALYSSLCVINAGGFTRNVVEALSSRIFLFFVVALVAGLLAREIVSARARQMAHTFELEHAAFAEMREVDRIKSEFMMLASHELRTPLTKIKAWLTLMHDAGDRLSIEARNEGLLELRGESEHLARLTDNLLCIAQLESGEIHLKAVAVDLETTLQEVIGRFVESGDRGRFICTVAPDAQRVLADRERIGLVLSCLVDNALKFSPGSEPVRITAHRVVTRVHVEVHDNGRRIPDGQIDRVFASFYQVESPLIRQRGGFGVGLYLARQLTERMGGKVWIDNTRSRGNTFVIALPVHV